MTIARLPRRTAAVAGGLALLLGACSADTASDTVAASTQDADGVRVVSVEAAAAMVAEEPPPTIIDVRTPEEFAQGHLEGAVLVDYNAPGFREAIAELPRDESYVIYCRSGNRSAGARQVMVELGFEDVADIDGGVTAWVAQGQPLTG